MEMLTILNMNQNEIQNAVIQNLAVAPSSPKKGQIYFDTTSNEQKTYNGTTWVSGGGGSGTDTNTTYTFAEGATNGTFTVTPSDGTAQSVAVHGLADGAYKAVDTTITSGSTSTNIPTSAAVDAAISTAISSIEGGVHFKGTIGTGGDYSDLPTTGISEGDMYIVVSVGTYGGQADCKIGDMFIAKSDETTWSYIPSGNDGDVYKYSTTNPELTGSGGVCAWTVTHNLGNQYPTVQIYEVSTGEMVIADVVATSASVCTISINADSLAAGVYKAVVMG